MPQPLGHIYTGRINCAKESKKKKKKKKKTTKQALGKEGEKKKFV